MNDLDRWLDEDETLVPSAGFTDRVMDAVAAADVEPAPLPFPWARLGAVVVAAAAWATSGVWLARTSAASALWSTMNELAILTPEETQYLGAVVAVTLVAAFVTMRKPRDIDSRG